MANPINRPYLTGMLLVMYQVLYLQVNASLTPNAAGTRKFCLISIPGDRFSTFSLTTYPRPSPASRPQPRATPDPSPARRPRLQAEALEETQPAGSAPRLEAGERGTIAEGGQLTRKARSARPPG